MTKVKVIGNAMHYVTQLTDDVKFLEDQQGIKVSEKPLPIRSASVGGSVTKFETSLPIADLMAHFKYTGRAMVCVEDGEVILVRNLFGEQMSKLLRNSNPDSLRPLAYANATPF